MAVRDFAVPGRSRADGSYCHQRGSFYQVDFVRIIGIRRNEFHRSIL